MKPITVCKKCIRDASERWGTKSHFAYLVVATVVDGPLILRITTGSCLAFCALGEWLKEENERLTQ